MYLCIAKPDFHLNHIRNAPVAQLDRVLDYKSRGRGSILPGAPFSLFFLNKLNDNSGLDHLSGPLLGPLSQFFRKRQEQTVSSLSRSKLCSG